MLASLTSLPLCSEGEITKIGSSGYGVGCRTGNPAVDFWDARISTSDWFADAFPSVFGGSPPTPVKPSSAGVPILQPDGSYLRPDGTTSSPNTLGPESDYEARMQSSLQNYDTSSGVLTPFIDPKENPIPWVTILLGLGGIALAYGLITSRGHR